MPSLQSAKQEWSKANPTMVPFVDGAEYAQICPPRWVPPTSSRT